MAEPTVPEHIPREVADVVRAWPDVMKWLEADHASDDPKRRVLYKLFDTGWRVWAYRCAYCTLAPSNYATCRRAPSGVEVAVQLVCDAHGGGPPA